MLVHLFCSYRRCTTKAFHPNAVRVVFKSAGTICSLTVKEDSIGGLKSTSISSFPDTTLSASRLSSDRRHSFRLRESQSLAFAHPFPKLNLVTVKFKIEFHNALPLQQFQLSQREKLEVQDDWELPKIDLVVWEETSSVPFLILSDACMNHRILFSRDNRVWLENLVGSHKTFEIIITGGECICSNEYGDQQIQFLSSTLEQLKQTIKTWVALNNSARASEVQNFLPFADQSESFLRDHYAQQLKKFAESQPLIQAAVSELQNQEDNARNPQIWDNLQEMLHFHQTFLETLMVQFKGVDSLLDKGIERGNPASLNIKIRKGALTKCLQDPWNTKVSSINPNQGYIMQSCIRYAQKLPWDVIEDFLAVLRLAESAIPNFKSVSFKDYCLLKVLKSSLQAATSYGQLKPKLPTKVVYGLPTPGKEPSSNQSPIDEELTLCRNFAFKFNYGRSLTIWPRRRYNPRSLDLERVREITSDLLLQKGLTRCAHTESHILLNKGWPVLQYLVIDTKILLNPRSTEAEFTKIIEVPSVVGPEVFYTFYGLYQHFILQVRIFSAASEGFSGQAIITPVDSDYNRKDKDFSTLLDLKHPSAAILKAYFIAPQSKSFFLSFGSGIPIQTKLGCWRCDEFEKSVTRVALCEIPQPQCMPPHQEPTARVTIGQKIHTDLQPIFLQTKGKVFYLSAPAKGFLLIYAFYKDKFLPVSSRTGGVHRAPEGFYFIPDTRVTKPISLYAVKQVGFDPKRFALKRVLLLF